MGHSQTARKSPGFSTRKAAQWPEVFLSVVSLPARPGPGLCSLVEHSYFGSQGLCFLMSLGFPGGSEAKAFAHNTEDLGSIPGSGRSPGEGNGNPLQYSCLENPMGRGAWWATAHRVTKSRTRLRDHFTFTLGLCTSCYLCLETSPSWSTEHIPAHSASLTLLNHAFHSWCLHIIFAL